METNAGCLWEQGGEGCVGGTQERAHCTIVDTPIALPSLLRYTETLVALVQQDARGLEFVRQGNTNATNGQVVR